MNKHILSKPRLLPFELWGGLEYTVNRVQDEYFNQLQWSGHATRPEDLDLFAQLGFQALRYPVLWETVAPESLDRADWSWTDVRLNRIRALGMNTIAGLVHHGSGPRYTSLVADTFAEGLARFAFMVAERYPWITHYTPVNEPLTTARFSGLYGHWYPHGRDGSLFARALVNQCRGIVLAMQAVRRINPDAKLVQTDDLGKTYSTPALIRQADYEKERRWLSYDLLCGKIQRHHPLWHYLQDLAVSEDDLLWFVDHPCIPDIMGFNYYLTSERFLDERVHLYPHIPDASAGTDQEPFVDLAAVRILEGGLAGPEVLLKEAWERYHLPLAITEIHNGSTRDEQLRWLVDITQAALNVYQSGVDVRAITPWALLGSHNWNTMCTRDAGYYERGIFDVRSPDQPRPTILAKVIQKLSRGEPVDHPVLDGQGWWRRPDRAIYGFTIRDRSTHLEPIDWSVPTTVPDPRPIIITGAGGTLGKAFMLLCELRGLSYLPMSRAELDITDEQAIDEALRDCHPWAVINAAGYVRVDAAERDAETCYQINTTGAVNLARFCARGGIPLLTFSTDLVFDGLKGMPYVESDPVNPLNVYGRSKAAAEAGVFGVLPEALVIRTSAFFGSWDDYNFVTTALRTLANGTRFQAADDTVITPTYILELVHQCLDLLIDGQSGIWHMANQGTITWADLARLAAELAGLNSDAVEGRPMRHFDLAARRPLYSALTSEHGILLTSVENALHLYLEYKTSGDRDLLSWETLAARMRYSVGRKDLLSEFVLEAGLPV